MSFRPKKKPAPLDEAALYNYAVVALGRRMRTVVELKRLMSTRVEGGESGEASIARVVERLKEYGYLNDTSYATTYTRLRQENEKFGRRRVQQELNRKGIPADTIAATVNPAYEAISEEELARQHLARKRIQQPTDQKQSARVVRRLIAAGFSIPIIFKILKGWQVSDDNLAALESVEVDEPADGV